MPTPAKPKQETPLDVFLVSLAVRDFQNAYSMLRAGFRFAQDETTRHSVHLAVIRALHADSDEAFSLLITAGWTPNAKALREMGALAATRENPVFVARMIDMTDTPVALAAGMLPAAAKSGHAAVVSACLAPLISPARASGPESGTRTETEMISALEYALNAGRSDIAHMIKHHLPQRDYDATLSRALLHCAHAGDVTALSFLLDEGVDPYAFGAKAVRFAAACGHAAAVDLLLAAGKDRTMDPVEAADVFAHALQGGHFAILDKLYARGWAQRTDMAKAVSALAERGKHDVALRILRRGWVHAGDENVRVIEAALVPANALPAPIDVFRRYLALGADPHARQGSAHRLARHYGRYDVLALFAEHDETVTHRTAAQFMQQFDAPYTLDDLRAPIPALGNMTGLALAARGGLLAYAVRRGMSHPDQPHASARLTLADITAVATGGEPAPYPGAVVTGLKRSCTLPDLLQPDVWDAQAKDLAVICKYLRQIMPDSALVDRFRAAARNRHVTRTTPRPAFSRRNRTKGYKK